MARAKKVPDAAVTEEDSDSKKKKKKAHLCVVVPPLLDLRVSVVAKSLRMTRTAFVCKILDQGCRGYKIDQSIVGLGAETSLENDTAA